MADPSAETAYMFRHALLRDAAYEVQIPGHRAILHELAAEVLCQVAGPRLVVLAGHEVARHYRLAAELSQAVPDTMNPGAGSPPEGRILRLLESEFALLEPLAQESTRRRDLVALVSVRHRQWTHPCQRDGEKPRAALFYAIALRMVGRMGESESIHRTVIASAEAAADPLLMGRAIAGLSTICQYTGRLEESERLVHDAIAMSRSLGNRVMLAVQLGNLGSLLKETGRPEPALAYTREAIELSRQTGQPEHECRFMTNLVGILVDTGQFSEAVAFAQDALRLARQLEAIDLEGVCHGNVACALAALGQNSTAELEFQRAFELARAAGDHRVAAIWASVLGLRAIRAGDVAKALSVLRLGLDSALEGNVPAPAARCQAMLSLIEQREGEPGNELAPSLALLARARDSSAQADIVEAASLLGLVLPVLPPG